MSKLGREEIDKAEAIVEMLKTIDEDLRLETLSLALHVGMGDGSLRVKIRDVSAIPGLKELLGALCSRRKVDESEATQDANPEARRGDPPAEGRGERGPGRHRRQEAVQ
jgi:hypothetical protein